MSDTTPPTPQTEPPRRPLARRLAPYVISGLIGLVLVELAAIVVDLRTGFRGDVMRALDTFATSREPVREAVPEGYPAEGVIVRVPNPPHMPREGYAIGGRMIVDAVPNSTRAVLEPGPDDGRMVFLVGGSAAFGYPYPYELTTTSRMDVALREEGYRVYSAADPATPSARVRFVVERVVEQFDAEVLVIYCGNNEWIRWQLPGQTGFDQRRLAAWRALSQSRFIAGVQHRLLARFAKQQETVRRSLHSYHIHHELFGYDYALRYSARDLGPFDAEAWQAQREAFVANYRDNLMAMIEAARSDGTRVILVTLPFQYRLSPAWKHPQPLAMDEANVETMRQRVRDAASRLQAGQHDAALAKADEAVALEPLAPLPHYLRGEALQHLGRPADAREAYEACRDRMVGNLGSIPTINRTIRTVAAESGVDLLDAKRLFDRAGEAHGEYLNESLIHDDCHPTPLGQQLIADSLVEMIRLDR